MSRNPILCAAAVMLLLIAPAANAASNSHGKTHLFKAAQGVPADGSIVPGSSVKLTRGESLAWFRLITTGLEPGAYTMWWVIFNNPEACGEACNAMDFPQNGGDPGVMASVMFATGGVVSPSGVGKFSAHIEEGVVPQGAQLRFGPGLLDAQAAEIHLVVKWHGPASSDPTLLQKQITTVFGGCSGGPGQPPDPVASDRLFPCFDPQAAQLPRPTGGGGN